MDDDCFLETGPRHRVLAVQDEGTTGSRDHHAAASVERAASKRSVEAETAANRPTVLHVALSPVSISFERRGHWAARDNHALASCGLPPVLALEVALAWRSTKGSIRN